MCECDMMKVVPRGLLGDWKEGFLFPLVSSRNTPAKHGRGSEKEE